MNKTQKDAWFLLGIAVLVQYGRAAKGEKA